MQRAARAASGRSPAEVRTVIQRFLESTSQPVLIEPGEAEIPLISGHYELELQQDRLTLIAWSEAARVTRRITSVAANTRGRLELTTLLFGNRPGSLTILDAARPQLNHVRRHSTALVFRERFRRFLGRQFTGWRVQELSIEADLEHTLSPRYPRASLRQGSEALAAIASDVDDAADVLTFGLLWLDYLQRRDQRTHYRGLILLLPAGAESTTRERLAWLDRSRVSYQLFIYSPNGHEAAVDLSDRGNLASDLPDLGLVPDAVNGNAADALVDTIGALDGVDVLTIRPGERALRVAGLEFARQRGANLTFGVETKQPANASDLPEITALARQLARWRKAGADVSHPLYQRAPERWLEANVRRQLEVLDATLNAGPVYGQVPTFTGQERGLIDLLTVDREGRLAVIELKATADPHLPLQALDYWMRVRWHWERGHFPARGYFPGIALSKKVPRLLLIAPALEYHPSTETILGYWPPEIPVERYGLASHWRKDLQVVFRLTGDRHPN